MTGVPHRGTIASVQTHGIAGLPTYSVTTSDDLKQGLMDHDLWYATPAGRMNADRCPECAYPARAHDGWGGPNGCTLTDNGVAQRIATHRRKDMY